MKDRDLLEKVAKAAGIDGVFRSFHQAYGDELVEGIDYGGRLFWNPLKDDGDALRLAVKRDLLYLPRFKHERDVLMFTKGMNKLEATRRAIVVTAVSLAD